MASRADENGPFKEFVFEDWLRERFEEFRQEMKGRKRPFERLDMSEFRSHLRNASKEQLLAMRSLIDSAIEYIDKQETGSKKA